MRFFKTALALASAALLAGAAASAGADTKIIKYAHFQPAKQDQPKHAAALAFKAYVESESGGSLQVQILPAGQFGKDAETMEGLRLGTLEMAVVHDGAIAGTFKPIIALGIPYLFKDQVQAWQVFDGAWGKDFGERMLQQTEIRALGIADNGVRHFTNSKKPIASPADLGGLKMRVQPSPVFQTLVSSLGASPSAIPWAELPTALQQGVVDGQENGVTNIMAASLYQFQKYATLDGHIYSVHMYLMNDAFWQSLTPDEQRIVQRGVEIAKVIHRGMTTAQDLNAKALLEGVGMEVTSLSAAQIDEFRKAAQDPVRKYVEEELGEDKNLVDGLFAAIKEGQ